MQTASGAFAAVVTSQDQIVDYSFVLSGLPAGVQASFGDLTKCVVSISNDESVTSTLPQGTPLISGYPSAQLTVTLQGCLNQNPGVALVEAQNVFNFFNINDPTSPMYRQPLVSLTGTLKSGVWDGSTTADLLPAFTGTIDEVVLSNGVVTLTLLDQSWTVRGASTLPPVVTPYPYNQGLTSEFPIDYLLRHSSPSQYLSWPALRPSCVFAAGMRSSVWPDVGVYPASQGATPGFAQGVYGTAIDNVANVNSGFIFYTHAPILPSQSVFIEGFYSISGAGQVTVTVADGTSSAFTNGYTVSIIGSAVQVSGFFGAGTGVATIGVTTTTSNYFAAQITCTLGSNAVSGTVRIGGTSHSFSFNVLNGATAVNRPSVNFDHTSLAPTNTATLEGVQVTAESAGAFNNGFSPTLILDPAGSLNPLTALPDVTGQTVWGTLQNIATAEAAVIGFDESGLCHFRNRNTIQNAASVRTLTSSSALIGADTYIQRSLVATHVQVPVNQLQVTALATVWKATSTIACPPGTMVIYANTQNPVVNVVAADSGYLPGSPNWANTYWRGCRTADGTGVAVTAGISIAVAQQSGSVLQVTITNSNGFYVYLVDPFGTPSQGQPTLFLAGQAVTTTPTGAESAPTTASGIITADAQWPPLVGTTGGAATNTLFGEILLALPENDWLQDLPTGNALAWDILASLHLPIPLYRNVTFPVDQRLQMVDRVSILDSDVSMITNDALIIGKQTNMSNGQWTQTCDMQGLYRPGHWVLGLAGSSELDLTTYL
jgi:hypothetical protein